MLYSMRQPGSFLTELLNGARPGLLIAVDRSAGALRGAEMLRDDNGEARYGTQATRAYHEIRMAIVTQKILPGTPITAAAFAEKLGMSRTPVREAIVRLAQEDLLRIIPRKGAFVRVFTSEQVRHNYEIAEALEGMIVFLATPRVTPKAIVEMEKQVEGMERALKRHDIETWVRLDEEFHQGLNSFCDNEYLVRNRAAIQSQILRTRLLRVPSWVDKDKSNRDHRAILEAVKNRDPKAARDAMNAHWERIREEFVRLSSGVASAWTA